MKNKTFKITTLEGDVLEIKELENNLRQIDKVLEVELTIAERNYWEDIRKKILEVQSRQRPWFTRLLTWLRRKSH